MLFTMVNFPVDFVSWHDLTLAKYCFSKVCINGLFSEILGGPWATCGGDSWQKRGSIWSAVGMAENDRVVNTCLKMMHVKGV